MTRSPRRGATALTEGLELATLNVRHYPMFPGLAQPFPT
jgi:predicted nucleic acid-binding protein